MGGLIVGLIAVALAPLIVTWPPTIVTVLFSAALLVAAVLMAAYSILAWNVTMSVDSERF
jgi:phage shock protein PspC (stress-responsive transcriptional regulator)